MATKQVKCPYCNRLITIELEEKIVTCSHCGEELLVKDFLDEDVETIDDYDSDEEGTIKIKASKAFVIEKSELLKYKGFDANVRVPHGITKVGKFVFSGDTDLKSIHLPSTLKVLGECAFEECSGLTEIVIPASVEIIDVACFDSCVNLKTVTFEEGSNLKRIAESAFVRCESLTQIKIPASCKIIEENVFDSCKRLWQLEFESGSKLEAIEENIFSKCDNLTKVYVPAQVTKIAKNAFKDCKQLRNIEIPEDSKLTSIGKNAFANCNIESIYLPSKLTTIGEGAFATPSLKKAIFAENTKMTTISKGAFSNASGLTNIVIPEGVSGIGANAFSDCTNLMKVELPKSLIEIEEGAFSNCKKLSVIGFKKDGNITAIGAGAFENCESLTYVNLPNSISELGEASFAKCDNLVCINIPELVDVLPVDLFRACKNLNTVTFSSNSILKTIETNAFYWCEHLEKVKLPQGLATIEEKAFEGCINMKEIYIPLSVEYIGLKGICGEKIFVDSEDPSENAESLVSKWDSEFYEDYKTTVIYNYKQTLINEEIRLREARKQAEEKAKAQEELLRKQKNMTQAPKKKEGCYVATCVYGSYDCKEVWTLRRYRDNHLKKSMFGRMFIKTYYAISPKVVRLFGDTKWFNRFFKNRLDKFVSKLNNEGYLDTPYKDEEN